MFNRLYKLFSEPKRVVSMASVVMVVCLLLLAAFYYTLGSTGGVFAAVGCALFVSAIFAPIPFRLKVSLEIVAATGLVRGGVMLGLSPGNTLFLAGALAFIYRGTELDKPGASFRRRDKAKERRYARRSKTHRYAGKNTPHDSRLVN